MAITQEQLLQAVNLAFGGSSDALIAHLYVGRAMSETTTAVFGEDTALYANFLELAKLQTELAQLQSEQRNAQATLAQANTTADAELAALAEAIAAKLAEIDAL